MLSIMSSCPMAAFILTLVLITIVLDSYVYFGLSVIPRNPLFLGVLFLFMIFYVVFTLWLANKTCYNFIWVSWLIVLYLVYSIAYSIEIIINPKKQEVLKKEIDAIMNQSENPIVQNPPQ